MTTTPPAPPVPPGIPPTAPGPRIGPSPDEQHLKILSICYYVVAGLNGLGICGGLLYAVMGVVFLTANIETANGPAPEGLVGGLMIGFGALIIVLTITFALLSFYTGRFLGQRRRRTFCMVVAGLTCLSVPLGTILGIFTFIVLLRPSVAGMFERAAPAD